MAQHRVPITVFCEVDGIDYLDAATIAKFAVHDALRTVHDDTTTTNAPICLSPRINGNLHPVGVHDVAELGIAFRNGYVTTQSTTPGQEQ